MEGTWEAVWWIHLGYIFTFFVTGAPGRRQTYDKTRMEDRRADVTAILVLGIDKFLYVCWSRIQIQMFLRYNLVSVTCIF